MLEDECIQKTHSTGNTVKKNMTKRITKFIIYY